MHVQTKLFRKNVVYVALLQTLNNHVYFNAHDNILYALDLRRPLRINPVPFYGVSYLSKAAMYKAWHKLQTNPAQPVSSIGVLYVWK